MENIAEQKQKICLVEDDLFIQEIYKTKLEEHGYRVFIANNGEEGYALIKKELPAIALIDILMPVKDGISLMKDMQNDPEMAKIPVIILTNQGDEKTIGEVAKLESHFYLEKAMFTPEKVAGIVREVLHNKG
jgi:two-component system alkaline phosphatase synthesis response regulator PhoP